MIDFEDKQDLMCNFERILKQLIDSRIKVECEEKDKEINQLSLELLEIKQKYATAQDILYNMKTVDSISGILTSKLNKENIYDILELLFTPTFTESQHNCNPVWKAYCRFYNDRKSVLELLTYVGADIPDGIEDVILPCDWSEEELDIFFKELSRHVNCNNCVYADNLQFYSYRVAKNPFHYTNSYTEIPWQFVLCNPLLNTVKYGRLIGEALSGRSNGYKFVQIDKYQELDTEVLSKIIESINVSQVKDKYLIDFLLRNISYIKSQELMNALFDSIKNEYNAPKHVLLFPKEYQIKYIEEIKEDPSKAFNYIYKNESFNKDEKHDLILQYCS